MFSLQPAWPSYLISGLIAVIASWVLTGCRFGNHVENTPNPDQFSGYYETQPQTLRFCTAHPASQCANVATNQVPQMISQIMTNPVALIMQDLDSGSAFLVAPTGKATVPVFVGTDSSLSFIGSTAPSPAWGDPICTNKLYIEEAGAVTKSSGKIVSIGTKSVHTSGRIAVKFQIINTFDGDCTQTLATMHDCYNDASKCGGGSDAENAAMQADVQDSFNPYIQAGAMTEADIPGVQSLAYEVSYQ